MRVVFLLLTFLLFSQPLQASYQNDLREDRPPRRGSIAHLMGWSDIPIDTTSSEEEEQQPLFLSNPDNGVSKCCCVTSLIGTGLLLSGATGLVIYCSLAGCV